MTDTGERCGTCRFWLLDLDPWPEHNKGSGGCRRHAPTLTNESSGFPRTHPTEWCGEYERGERT